MAYAPIGAKGYDDCDSCDILVGNIKLQKQS